MKKVILFKIQLNNSKFYSINLSGWGEKSIRLQIYLSTTHPQILGKFAQMKLFDKYIAVILDARKWHL